MTKTQLQQICDELNIPYWSEFTPESLIEFYGTISAKGGIIKYEK